MSSHLIPYVLCVLDLLCAATYAVKHDWPRVAYWVSAAILTYSTTAMK